MKDRRLGIRGWIYGGKHNPERFLYTLHRLTGVLLVLYLSVHILVVGSRAFGQEAWEGAMRLVGLGNPVVRILEYLLVAVVVFHAVNGSRLILGELGFTIGRPRRPVYPYPKESIRKPRPLLWFLMILAAVYLVFAAYNFFVLPA